MGTLSREATAIFEKELGLLGENSFRVNPLLYARLKNGRIMLYPSASVRLSVRPSVNVFVCV